MTLRKCLLAMLMAVGFMVLGQTGAQAATICTNSLANLIAADGNSICSNVDFTLNFQATDGAFGANLNANVTVVVTSTGPNNLDVQFMPTATIGSALGVGTCADCNFHYTVTFAGGYAVTAATLNLI